MFTSPFLLLRHADMRVRIVKPTFSKHFGFFCQTSFFSCCCCCCCRRQS